MKMKTAALYVGAGSLLVIAICCIGLGVHHLRSSRRTVDAEVQITEQQVALTALPAQPVPQFTLTRVEQAERKAGGPGPFWDAEGEFFPSGMMREGAVVGPMKILENGKVRSATDAESWPLIQGSAQGAETCDREGRKSGRRDRGRTGRGAWRGRFHHIPPTTRLETLITASSGWSCRDESQLNFSSECGGRLAETGDGEGRIPGIENPIQGRPTGFHAGGELSLGDVFLFQDLLELERHHTLEGEHFDFGTNSLIYEEVAEITSAMDVLGCFGFHFRCSFM
jgi:hypothetical protein